MELLLISSIALLSGVAAGWLARGLTHKAALVAAQARCAAIEEQLARRNQELEELKSNHAHAVDALRTECGLRAAAEAKVERIPALETALADCRFDCAKQQSRNAELETRIDDERIASAEKLALIDRAQIALSDSFKALSVDALAGNNKSFMTLAQATLEKFHEGARSDLESRRKAVDELVRPIQESLVKVDDKLGELEKVRLSTYCALNEQLKGLVETDLPLLHSETANLVKALRQPTVRGRWGEMQLRRVVEMAGMVEHCDFVEQESRSNEDGRLRPDLIVRLPAGRRIVVDAKAPISAYLNAIEAKDETARQSGLVNHAR